MCYCFSCYRVYSVRCCHCACSISSFYCDIRCIFFSLVVFFIASSFWNRCDFYFVFCSVFFENFIRCIFSYFTCIRIFCTYSSGFNNVISTFTIYDCFFNFFYRLNSCKFWILITSCI